MATWTGESSFPPLYIPRSQAKTTPSLDILESEASKADIVINTADVDHTASPPALLRGLSRPLPTETPGTPPKPRFLIHTSGTSILSDASFGTSITTHTYHDLDRVDELVHTMPDTAWHRDADKLVLFSSSAPRAENVFTAIICPSCIYGRGTGPGKIVSFQLPQLIKHFLKRGKGFTVNAGETVWGNIHILDLAKLYAALFDKALSSPTPPEPGLWNQEGYYLGISGEHHWGHVCRMTAHSLQQKGLLKTAEVDPLTPEEIAGIEGLEVAGKIWGCNSRGVAKRAQEKLGWWGTRGTRELPVGEWVTGRAQGIGRREVNQEVDFWEEGLVN